MDTPRARLGGRALPGLPARCRARGPTGGSLTERGLAHHSGPLHPHGRARTHPAGRQEGRRARGWVARDELLPEEGARDEPQLLVHTAGRQHRRIPLHLRRAQGQPDHRGPQHDGSAGLHDRQPRAGHGAGRLQAARRRIQPERVRAGDLPLSGRQHRGHGHLRGRHPLPGGLQGVDVALGHEGRLHRRNCAGRALQAQPRNDGGPDLHGPDRAHQLPGSRAEE